MSGETHEGSEGLANLITRIAKSNPRVNIVRIFAGGDFVFGHTEYDFSTQRIFCVADGKLVEHWKMVESVVPKSESKNNNGKF